MVLVRAAAIAIAVVVCAWFALGVVQARDTGAATAIASAPRTPTPKQIAHARSLLDAAGTLNPDLQVDLTRAQLALRTGDTPSARRTLRSVLAREPMNIQAWLLFAQASYGTPASLVAVHHIGLLDPRG